MRVQCLAALVLVLAAALAARGDAATPPPPLEIVFLVASHDSANPPPPPGTVAIRPDGSGLRQVAADGEGAAASPDGRWIAVGSASGLEIVGGGGGPALRLPGGSAEPIGWSPDSRRVAFVRLARRGGNLYVATVDGRTALLARNAGAAGWSPDGRWLLVHTAHAVRMVGLTGGSRTLRTPCAAAVSEALLSPDGRWIVDRCCPGSRYPRGIAVERVDGTHYRCLVHTRRASESDLEPAWAPDSRRLAYVHEQLLHDSEATEHGVIRMITIAGRPLGNLDATLRDLDTLPAWSPDGRSIAFLRMDGGVGEAPSALLVGDARTGRVHGVYDSVAGAVAPAWRRVPAGGAGR